MLKDFSKARITNKRYGGSERKLGILLDGKNFMMKFQKKTQFGKRYNHISEYLGSHIFELLGFDVHETRLGTYKGEEVVVCKDFVEEFQFVPFNDVGESTIETDIEKYQYSYENIIKLLEANTKLTNIDQTVSIFFEIYIVDALIGNFDRHGYNWGFLKDNDQYKLAPIFDNGSSLYPQMVNEDEMIYVLNNQEEIDKRVYQFPTSQILLNGVKSSYFDVIASLQFEECNNALEKVFKRIKMDEIISLVDGLEISDIHKEFYKRMLNERYNKILKFSYEKLVKNK